MIPIKFWVHYNLTTVFIINRLSSTVLGGKSPFEIFHMKRPSLDHMRTPGCLCYAKRMNVHNKFKARVIATTFMGYSTVIKGYILYDLSKHSFFTNGDVTFIDNTFSFRLEKPHIDNMFLDAGSLEQPKLVQEAEMDLMDSIVDNDVAQERIPPMKMDIPYTTCPDMVYEDPTPAAPVQPHDTSEVVPNGADTTSPLQMNPPPLQEVRKSSRDKRVPIWMTDYITTSNQQPHSVSNSVCYSN